MTRPGPIPRKVRVVTDPVMLSVASTVAAKAADAAADGARTAVAALVRLIRGRLGKNNADAMVLDDAQSQPGDQAAVVQLATVLERMAEADPGFGSHLRVLWPQAQAELAARDGGVVNTSTGTVGGHLIQVRDMHVQGNLQLGDVSRPSAP
jgi:hypothetical protein